MPIYHACDTPSHQYVWQVNGADASTAPFLSSDQFVFGDTITCQLTPFDGTSAGAPVQATAEVANTPPQVTDGSLAPAAPTVQDTLSVTSLAASDPDGQELTYRYAWTIDGQLVGEDPTLSGEFSRGQTVAVSVTPFDGIDDGAPWSTSVTIENTVPTLTSASIVTPGEPATTNDTLSVAWEGADADGDAYEATITWTVGGATFEGASLDGSRFQRGDLITATVVLSDDAGASEPFTTAPIEIGNSAPTLTGGSIDIASPTIADTLTCSGEGFDDADGDPIAYRYAWYMGQTLVGEEATLSLDTFSRSDTLFCEVTPFDGLDSGTSFATAPVTIGNSIPTVASVSFDPPRNGLALTPAFTDANDIDGDAISYTFAWSVDGAPVSTDPVFTPANLEVGVQIALTATPSDGSDEGAPVSFSLTLDNTAPQVTRAVLSPDGDVRTADAIHVSYEASDIDPNQTLAASYAWYIDGALQPETSDTLPAGAAIGGQTVYAEVTVQDGTDSSTPFATASLVLADTAPTQPVVAVSPKVPAPGEAVTCELTTEAEDADGDVIEYAYSIYVNEELIAERTTSATSGATVPPGTTLEDDAIRCEAAVVQASTGTPVSATAEVMNGWQFSNCGVSGRFGPETEDCGPAYIGTNLEGAVAVDAGFQTWTVPMDGTYAIQATGAAGGSNDDFGRGATMYAEFALNEGDEITVIVAQQGGDMLNFTDLAGGGGGASWVFTDIDAVVPMVVGGGGGGGATAAAGADASVTQDATTGGGSGSGAAAAKGEGGLTGETVGFDFTSGAGGAGWNSDGEDGTLIRAEAGTGGAAPFNGAVGGLYTHPTYSGAHGGFGGGGAASDYAGAAGGGAGFTGGSGGNGRDSGGSPFLFGAGGGGGSAAFGFIVGTDIATSASSSGHGDVFIERIID